MAQSIADHRRKVAVTLLAVAAFGLVAVGCGRRGEPERPGAAVVTGDEQATQAVEPATRAEEKAARDRPFILDPLIQ